jgi:hypothetical protein
VRYFFHIVDKYGLCPDGIGCECADQDAAVLHARHIATELAKAGELFRELRVGRPRRYARIDKSS